MKLSVWVFLLTRTAKQKLKRIHNHLKNIWNSMDDFFCINVFFAKKNNNMLWTRKGRVNFCQFNWLHAQIKPRSHIVWYNGSN